MLLSEYKKVPGRRGRPRRNAATVPITTPLLARRDNSAGERTRTALLHTAARLFAQRGYDNVSVRDIAAEMKLSASLVIFHFGSKAGLYRKILRYYLDNGALFLRCALPVTRVDVNDGQACANAVAESVHLFFDCWHGPNRIRHLDRLLLQVIFGRGSVESSQTLEWIGPTERIFEHFFRSVNPAISEEDADVRMEVFFGNIFYPAVIKKLLMSEHNWSDFPVPYLLRWKKQIAGDTCAALSLPPPRYIYPEEADPDYYARSRRPDIETRPDLDDAQAIAKILELGKKNNVAGSTAGSTAGEGADAADTAVNLPAAPQPAEQSPAASPEQPPVAPAPPPAPPASLTAPAIPPLPRPVIVRRPPSPSLTAYLPPA
jgi:AcrR family transcriptional regulator